MTEDWTKWESQIINGVFPLRRFLGRSNHSVVFLTECKAQNFPNAAIKLVPADPVLTEARLSYWRTVATLSHPHLIRLLDAGRCQLGGHEFLFVVMEYAEQTLAQILPHRALTPDEVREMLHPTLDALAFLHRKNLVQGQLKPPNFLVVNDQLKLASDTIRPAGESAASIAKPSLYDAPEAINGSNSAAGDIWGLGITIVEALTQCPPAWPDERSETDSLPATLPPAFVDTVRRCLSRNPANRPTITDLEAQFKPAPPASVVSVPQPVVPEAPGRAAPAPKSPKRRLFVPAIGVVLIVLAAVWAGLRLFHSHPISQQPASSTTQTSSQQAAAPAAASQNPKTSTSAPREVSALSSSAKPAESEPALSRPVSRASDQSAQALADVSPSVLHQEIPDVPRSARESIHGHIKVTLRVIVDRSGNVVDETLEDPGSSKYFARLATAAARKWKFAPADNQHSREWLLRFEFTREGTTGHAATPRP
ncbi:MAG: protein kinase [Steroidobacterales bacterium]